MFPCVQEGRQGWVSGVLAWREGGMVRGVLAWRKEAGIVRGVLAWRDGGRDGEGCPGVTAVMVRDVLAWRQGW